MSRGLKGEKLTGEWSAWLSTTTDYGLLKTAERRRLDQVAARLGVDIRKQHHGLGKAWRKQH